MRKTFSLLALLLLLCTSAWADTEWIMANWSTSHTGLTYWASGSSSNIPSTSTDSNTPSWADESTYNKYTGTGGASNFQLSGSSWKSGNPNRVWSFDVAENDVIKVYFMGGGTGNRSMYVSYNATTTNRDTETAFGSATADGYTPTILSATATTTGTVYLWTDQNVRVYAIKVISGAATNNPVDPAFTPDGGSVEGNTTVTIASTYAQKIYYCWSNNETAPIQGDASYTVETGASATVTVPNVAGPKYLHAYGWNNKNTNTYTNTITKTFTITAGKEFSGLAYAETAVAKYTTDANFTNALTNPHSLTVTYSVADGATATGVSVNASTGEVTIGSVAGTATIKATFAGNNTYQAGEASYVLTVTKPTCAVPTYTLSSYNYEQGGYEIVASCATEGATLQYKIGEGSYTACTADVAFYAKNGKLVIKASKDGYNDATIASSDQWTLTEAPSATSPETLIPFQTSNDNGDKNKEHIYKSVTFGENNAASSIAGLNGSNGLKIRTNQTHGDFENSIKFYVHSGYKVTNIQITGNSNNSGSGATIDVNGMYVDGGDNAISSVDGNKTFPISSASAKTFSTGDIEATDNIVLTFDNSNIDGTTNKKNNQLKVSIVVTYEVTSVSGTITPAGWASFSSSYPLNLSSLTATSGATAYYASAASGSTVTLTSKTGTVAAGTGLMIKGTAGETFTIDVAASGTDISGSNLLKASDGSEVAESTVGTYHYIFGYASSSVYGFYNLASSVAIPAGKAYLETDEALTPSEPNAPSIIRILDEENNATSIESIDGKNDAIKFIENGQLYILREGVVYDALGRKVR